MDILAKAKDCQWGLNLWKLTGSSMEEHARFSIHNCGGSHDGREKEALTMMATYSALRQKAIPIHGYYSVFLFCVLATLHGGIEGWKLRV